VFVVGDGQQKELFSLVFKAPPNTAIQPHSHPDERSCFVLSGLSYFAYGTVRDETKQKALPPGSNYTEPAGAAHFAGTREQEAIVECTAVGPTGMGHHSGVMAQREWSSVKFWNTRVSLLWEIASEFDWLRQPSVGSCES